MTKTAKQILFEHGINIMELNDDFNTHLLHAMEEYASQPSAGLGEVIKEMEDELPLSGECDSSVISYYLPKLKALTLESPSTIDARQIASDAWGKCVAAFIVNWKAVCEDNFDVIDQAKETYLQTIK